MTDTGRERDGAHTSFVVDRRKLPPLYPTHLHDAAFWCSLGRAVATFGFLEEMLKRAVFALTGTRPAPEDEAARVAAVEDWHGLLARSIANPLNSLIDTFGKAARLHPDSRHQNLDEFVKALRAAAKVRNVICHGSWGAPNETGASVPFYVTGKPGQQEAFETPVTAEWLDQLRAHAAALACEVINTVTHMGYQFPGGDGPGRPVL